MERTDNTAWDFSATRQINKYFCVLAAFVKEYNTGKYAILNIYFFAHIYTLRGMKNRAG